MYMKMIISHPIIIRNVIIDDLNVYIIVIDNIII